MLTTSAPPHPLRILIVTTGRILAPASGGELRTHHLARALAALGHHVEVAAFVARNHPAGSAQPAPNLAIHQRHTLWLDLALLADRARLVPVTELPLWLAPLRAWLRRRVRRERCDVVQFDFPWFTALYGAAAPARVVYSAQNVESSWWAPRLAAYPLGNLFTCRLERHETSAAACAAGVAACSEADLAWLKSRAGAGGRPYQLVPNGFDPERVFIPNPELRARLRRELGFAPGEKIALFCGSHTHPNREAAEQILRTIAPACPAVRFVIVGRVGEILGGLLVKNDSGRVTITGPVPDVVPYLQAADVALNPMRSGSGSNIKVAEACAAGLPLVTTAFGLRGFEPLAPYVSVCEIDEFPPAIERAVWPNAAPPEAIAQFSWPASARALARLYQEILTPTSTL